MIDANGTHVRKVLNDGIRPSWSPDGTRIVYFRPDLASPLLPQIHVVNTDGSGHRRLA